MRWFIDLTVSLGMARVFLIPAAALAQAPDPDAPFKPAPARKPDFEYLRGMNDRLSRHYFQGEYHFIDKACLLTPEQAKVIARNGERAFQEVIRELVEKTVRALDANKPVPPRDDKQIRDAIRGKLVAITKEHVTSEQMKRIQVEYEKRTAVKRKVDVEAILELIDRELILTDAQCEAIRRSLDSRWHEDWIATPDLLLSGRLQLPAIPDSCVVGFLTETQRNAWTEIPKGPPRYIGAGRVSMFLAGGGNLEPDVLREARRAESSAREDAKRRNTARAAK